MQVLAVNCGSSTIKLRLARRAGGGPLAEGRIERMGAPLATLRIRVLTPEAAQRRRVWRAAVGDHARGLALLTAALEAAGGGLRPLREKVTAVGHRVVHGAAFYHRAVRIDAGVRERIAALAPLAPLHNPANLAGIEAACRLFPRAVQVAVFDTAFHQSIPAHAHCYGLPRDLCRRLAIRRYGFHGTSHRYMARRAMALLGPGAHSSSLITLHLGSGCSLAAVRDGRSIDTSMGFTPGAGILMGTRSGDIDPGLPGFLAARTAMTPQAIDALLIRDSGLKGICGDNDLRDIHRRRRQGDPEAQLAFEMFCYGIRKQIGAYTAALGSLDALVFSAGIGENDPETRAACCAGLDFFGIRLDPGRNQARADGPRAIHAADSRVALLVVPCDEERAITEETLETLAGDPR
jgi:acetate kinase